MAELIGVNKLNPSQVFAYLNSKVRVCAKREWRAEKDGIRD